MPEAVFADNAEMSAFLKLLDTNALIKYFLEYDCCYRLADKYLIAMVFVYFRRAELAICEYSYLNFFAGLCLAHAMEEEDESLLVEIYLWALGEKHVKELLPSFQNLKFKLWQSMNYRSAVSQHCCCQVMKMETCHPVWRRKRDKVHCGAPLYHVKTSSPSEYRRRQYDEWTNSCWKCRHDQQLLFRKLK